MLVEMIDGGIVEIYADSESYGGCETCDFGSQYINEFEIEMTKGKLVVKIDDMYGYAVSEDYMMKLFLLNIEFIKSCTEDGFTKWLENILKEDFKYVEELEFDYYSKEGKQ